MTTGMNNSDPDVEAIAETIIWVATERIKQIPYQDINSAVHAVRMEISVLIQDFMSKHKGGKQ